MLAGADKSFNLSDGVCVNRTKTHSQNAVKKTINMQSVVSFQKQYQFHLQ